MIRLPGFGGRVRLLDFGRQDCVGALVRRGPEGEGA